MTAKVRKALLYILICLVILTLFTASLTLGRFTSEEGSKGNYGGQDFEFTVSDMIEISSEDEFFTAIENGYNNIQISDDIDKIIISGGVSEVGADLTIDLNGKELQRNNCEPMLDVQEGVRLTIIDTSDEQTGCFYNPVGTVLRVSGGTLTVNAGTFESGPRDDHADNAGHKSEYASNSNGPWSTPKTDIVVNESTNEKVSMPGAKIEKDASVSLQQWDRDNRKWSNVDNVAMPVIIPGAVQVVDGNSARIKVNGNMYFADEGGYDNNKYIPEDTYLYFTLEDEVVDNTTIAADGTADYKYSYYLTRNGAKFTYDSSYNEDTKGAIKVTIFVYQGVKGAARSDGSGNESTSFAAIQMVKGDGGETGNIYVQKGSDYHAYFGVDNTYCVQASAGYMAVEGGTFRAYGNSVCVACSYDTGAADDEYLRVGSGTFYSENADTVCVTGGKMDVVNATLEKNSKNSTNTHNGAAIKVEGGSLSVTSGATITVEGDNNYGIFSDGVGLVRINTANSSAFEMSLEGSNNYGIYSQPDEGLTEIKPIVIGSTASSLSGGVTANITISGNNSRAIYSEGGDIGIANGGGTVTFTLTGQNLQGIYAIGGRIDVCKGGGTATFTMQGQKAQGIESQGGSVYLCYEKGGKATFNITSNNPAPAEGGSDTGADATYSRAIYVNGGNVNIGKAAGAGQDEGAVSADVTFTLGGDYLQGVHVLSGQANICAGGGTATFNLGVDKDNNIIVGADTKQSTNISGIVTTGGSDTAANIGNSQSTFTLNAKGNTMSGIFGQGGEVNVHGTATFTLSGSSGGGIYALGGEVNLGDDTAQTIAGEEGNSVTFTLSGSDMRAVSVSSVTSSGETYQGSANIYAPTTIEMKENISSSYGIYAEDGSVTIQGTATIEVGAGAKTIYGIFNQKGAVTLRGKTVISFDGVASDVKKGEGVNGIYAEDGSVTIDGADLTINLGQTEQTLSPVTNSNGIWLEETGETGQTGSPLSSLSVGGTATINVAGGSSSTNAISNAGGAVTIGGTATINVGANATTVNAISNAGGAVTIGGTAAIAVGANAQTVNGISNSGTVKINGASTMQMAGGSSVNGVYSTGGEVTFGGNAVINISSRADEDNSTTYAASSNSHGIYATGGTVNIGGSSFVCKVNQNVENDNTALSATNIFSTGAQINISSDTVTLNSRDLGIVLTGGNLNFGSDTQNSTITSDTQNSTITIDTPRGTGIYVAGGSLTAYANATVSVKSTISGATWSVVSQNNIYNGVFVNGGSLKANGTFNVTHKGVENDDVDENEGMNSQQNGVTEGNAYRTFKIKSFAVRVEAGSSSNTSVTLTAGNITNSVGGGVYVSGGEVVLGTAGSSGYEGVKVTTEGNKYYEDYDNYGNLVKYTVEGHSGNWSAPVPQTGGHAVEIVGGKITIHNGTYSSALGNGILVSNGEAIIKDGKFDGTDYTTTIGGVAGAAANYGFKMYGGTVTINKGTFSKDKSGSGAFVMGTGTGTATAIANIYGGTFEVNGQAGFSVYQYANVTFGNENTPNSAISAKGAAAGLTVETTPKGDAPTITINAGQFSSTSTVNDGSGIWYGNGSAKLTINGGEFIGTSKSGLWIDKDPGTNIQLSGGTFTTISQGYNAIAAESDWMVWYADIIANGHKADVTYRNWGRETYNENSYIDVNSKRSTNHSSQCVVS